MNKTMKKLLPIIIIAIVVIVAAVVAILVLGGQKPDGNEGPKDAPEYVGDSSFISQIGGVSETYKGSVSDESYESSKEAAEAFILNEVVGEADSNVLSAETIREYTVETVDISIPADILEGADKIEKVSVTYEVEKPSEIELMSSRSSGQTENHTVTVYVIKYGVDFKYFTPMPITGETISKSYYDSVFNYEKYKNCTLETSMTMSVSANASYEGETMTMEMTNTTKQVVKIDGDRIYLYMQSKTTQTMTGSGESSSDTQENTVYAYLEEVDGRTYCYYKANENDEWMRASLGMIGFSSVEELTPFYNEYLDYTYFTKTTYGFALEKENAKQYFMQAFEQLMDSMMGIEMDNDDIDMTVRYYVQDGVLSGSQTDASVNVRITEDEISADMKVSVEAIQTCTNYGTTSIERPNVD